LDSLRKSAKGARFEAGKSEAGQTRGRGVRFGEAGERGGSGGARRKSNDAPFFMQNRFKLRRGDLLADSSPAPPRPAFESRTSPLPNRTSHFHPQQIYFIDPPQAHFPAPRPPHPHQLTTLLSTVFQSSSAGGIWLSSNLVESPTKPTDRFYLRTPQPF
jgi:hypothetical protein